MLTIEMLTRSFAFCLQQIYPFELNSDAIQQGQLHVDLQLDRAELAQTLDDFICKVIEPAAINLAQALKTRGARFSIPLELPTPKGRVLSSCRILYNGCNLRGIIEHNQRIYVAGHPIFVEAVRFDILWSK